MSAGVLLVKSLSAGSGKTLLTVFRLHYIDLQGGFIFSATEDTERTEHKFAFIYPCKFALYPYN